MILLRTERSSLARYFWMTANSKPKWRKEVAVKHRQLKENAVEETGGHRMRTA
ncbi:hypothetical protein TIFTF001_016077 [Ficus carica]|uniref:Uncharacterized protein n=1 Tax=Ficus carica TaxID=3494 RepID=A0AA88A9X6_FICCA|nr:hypothetical protein TIFTF001_016077 [Ficus carica]